MTDHPAPVRAIVSHAALRANADRLRASGAANADLRRDAWGHGLAACADTVAASGLHVIVDDEAAVAASAGAPADGDARTLWGLPGGAGRPVMSLVGRLLSTKTLRAGEGVSYGYLFRAPHDTTVGLVAGGYAQGVVREVGGRVRVRVGEHSVPIVGRVAMDACVVELGSVEVGPGADVVFFGDPDRGEPDLSDWERATALRAAEIVSLVGARARREDVG